MKALIVSNWKMNPVNSSQVLSIFNSVKSKIKNLKKCEVVICPPFVYLDRLKSYLSKTNFILGAQNCFWESSGAFTGEISPLMLKNLNCRYVIIGHSERRKYLFEKEEMIDKKIRACLMVGLKPIVCLSNLKQFKSILKKDFSKKVILAFEPLSAIGTGKPYSIEKSKKIRFKVKHPFLLYGGSVDSKNAFSYIKKAGFQGILVGSASLKSGEFVSIVKSLEKFI